MMPLRKRFSGAAGFFFFLFLFLNCYSEDTHTQRTIQNSPLWQMSPALIATDGAPPSQPLPQAALHCTALHCAPPPPRIICLSEVAAPTVQLQISVRSAAPPSAPPVAFLVWVVVLGLSMLAAFHCLALSTSLFLFLFFLFFFFILTGCVSRHLVSIIFSTATC